jgi:uncharacterized protein YeaO (DUF488 family)
MARAAHVQVRRVNDPPKADDGRRVLVDRLWPRGLSKERARLDDWCKEIAPSTELRVWYDHDPDRYSEFARRYRAELGDPERAAAFAHLRELAGHGRLTLLTASSEATLVIAESRHPIGVPVKGGPGSRIRARTGILTGRSPAMTTSSPDRAGRRSNHPGRPADHRTRARGGGSTGTGLRSPKSRLPNVA